MTRLPLLPGALAVLALAVALGAAPARAEPAAAELGVTNPEELTLNRVLGDIREGRTSMTACAAGYLMTKSGRHAPARETFRACAEAGYPGAMTWMSQLENNGLGAPYDPDAAAEWDRRAALTGDPVGQFNHGLDLIRGHGVARDEARGRMMIDAAAAQGLDIARRMQAAGYDPEEVTPDADRWKYAPGS